MRVTRIDIQVGSLSVIAIERTCIKGRRWHEYPLTERNYWRAVGLQLRLAGFASSVPAVARQCEYAELHELYWTTGSSHCSHCGVRLYPERVLLDNPAPWPLDKANYKEGE